LYSIRLKLARRDHDHYSISYQGQTLTTTNSMTDFQIPTVAHGGRGRKPGDDPKLLRQRGAIRGLVRGARHKSATVTEDDIATYGRELVAQYEVGTVAVKLAAIRQLYEAAV
jgi:hypothetical protein